MKLYHVYMRGRNGWGIFYRLADFLFFYTLFSVLTREMGLKVVAFNIMFNHIHSGIRDISRALLTAFQHRLTRIFVSQYNEEYGRSGPLFQKSFGRSVKSRAKKILACVAYIFNNPVAGHLTKTAEDYRWSLLAYSRDTHPFSEKIVIREARRTLRRSLKTIDTCFEKGQYLNYATLRRIYHDLNAKEKKQVTDYILQKYMFLDLQAIRDLYGSLEKALISFDSNAGQEYDLVEENEDHSFYRDMVRIMNQAGLGDRYVESLPTQELRSLQRTIQDRLNPPAGFLRRFFHQERPIEGGRQLSDNQE